MAIHPTAIVDAQARIADSAEIGPYCIIGSHVHIGARTRLIAHAYVGGVTKEDIENLHKAFRLLTKSGLNTRQAVERISSEVEIGPEIEELLAFIAASERGFVK